MEFVYLKHLNNYGLLVVSKSGSDFFRKMSFCYDTDNIFTSYLTFQSSFQACFDLIQFKPHIWPRGLCCT